MKCKHGIKIGTPCGTCGPWDVWDELGESYFPLAGFLLILGTILAIIKLVL